MKRAEQIGDVVATSAGRQYIYLGRYIGRPFSYKDVAESGHLYLEWVELPMVQVSDYIHTKCKAGFDSGDFVYLKNHKLKTSLLVHHELDMVALSSMLNSTLGIQLKL